jgi:hypothetical protein
MQNKKTKAMVEKAKAMKMKKMLSKVHNKGRGLGKY